MGFMTKKTLEQLQEEHSEMCATAADLGMTVPKDLTTDFDSVEVGATVVANLDALIRKFREGLDEEDAGGDEPQNDLAVDDAEVQTKAPKKTAAKKPKAKKVQVASDSKKELESDTNNEENTVAKKAAKKVGGAKKVAGKTKAAKKAGATKKKNGSATKTARTKFPEDANITWTGKENPAREGKGRFDRIEAVRKASGKTVKTFLASGGNPTTLKNCVAAKLATVA
jgi:hypothetical protein